MVRLISIAVLICASSSVLFAMDAPLPAAFAWYSRPEAQHYLLQQHISNSKIITITFVDDLDSEGQPRQSFCALTVLNSISSVLGNCIGDTDSANAISVKEISLQAFMLAAYGHYLKDIMKIDISKEAIINSLHMREPKKLLKMADFLDAIPAMQILSSTGLLSPQEYSQQLSEMISINRDSTGKAKKYWNRLKEFKQLQSNLFFHLLHVSNDEFAEFNNTIKNSALRTLFPLNEDRDREFLRNSKGSAQTIIELLQHWYFERPTQPKTKTQYGYDLPFVRERLENESRAFVGEKRDPDGKIYDRYYKYLKKTFIKITKDMFKTIGADVEIKIYWETGKGDYMNLVWFKGFDEFNKQ